MPAVTFRGGGSLDGWEISVREHVTSFTTSGGSHYEISGGEAVFTGLGAFGREFSMRIRDEREIADADRQAVLAASQPQGCGQCGRMFGNAASYTVHRDEAWGCLEDDAHGQLVDVDGVLFTHSSAPR